MGSKVLGLELSSSKIRREFIRSQLRPHADWIGSEWVKSKNKVLSQHMFRTGKLVEMTREISERKHSIVDICKIRPSPPRDLCAEYSLNDYVEVVVTHGWRKGRVMEILLENNYKVEFENNAATPIRPAQESPSNTLVLESNEDDTVNDDATEIKSSRESHSNTSFIEATETETQNHEPVDGVELPLPHESDDMMDDVATPNIDPQEIPRGKMVKRQDLSSSSSVRVCSDTNPQPHLLIYFYIPPFSISLITKTYFSLVMSKSDDKIALPKRISEPGTNGGVLDRINKRSNLKLVGKKGLWFSFGEQLMRFSLREFHLATGLPCVVDKDEEEVETSATKNKKKDPWMKKNQTLNTLLNLLVKKSTELTADQRLRLGATILVEGILMASNPVTSIPEERLLRARNFKEFCKYPWGNLAFDYLRKEVESFTYTKNDENQFPLCLHWIETKSLTIEEVDVKCILGDPELHSDLVEDVDYWLNRSVDIAVAEAEVDENNSAPGTDATDQEKIEFLTKKVVSLEEKVKYLKGLLNIRGETVKKSKETEAATKTKVNGQNTDHELDETEVLQDYIDAKRQEIAKGKKNGVRPPREKVTHQKSMNQKKKRNNKKKMIQKSMWMTVIKRVKIQKPMKDRHKRKRNNNKRMTHKSMQMWTSVLKKVKIQKPMN
ncbi:BnaCnng57620D [Brassica napus]|uniref:BnaCnng57620D protein n=1 Tax=Brassica napus TaxID=3708 RepID=A0A078JNQ2_BRANA|nr:BnaCnng57620D [Brassica napus]